MLSILGTLKNLMRFANHFRNLLSKALIIEWI